MKYYHATDMKNLGSICTEGLKAGMDGIVYLTEKPEDALKFVIIRMVSEILIVEVELNPEEVEEQFDHSEAFFKCRAYGYTGDVPVEKITDYKLYKLYE